MRFTPSIWLVALSLGLCIALVVAAPDAEKRDDVVGPLLEALQGAVTCTACETVLVLLKTLATLGDKPFVNTIVAICKLAKIEDDDVCEGAIGQEGPILAHDLRGLIIPSHTAQLVCYTIFGLCDPPEVTPRRIAFPAPKPANSTRPAPSGKTPLSIVHISDIHVDLSYETGANYNCTKNICCRPYTPADAPGNTSYPAGPFGNPHCDSPLSLEQSMYAAIAKQVPDAAFTIFTGDIVEGAVWLVSQEENTNDISDAYNNQMKSTLGLVYGAIGNHEAAPVNALPPSDVKTTQTNQWVYDTLSSDWESWIGPDAAAQAKEYGSYAVKYPHGNLKVISFNSILYYIENFWLYQTIMTPDPDGQLAWLVQELQAAEDAQQRVWLISHMPMGSHDAFHDPSNAFNQIVTRYADTIAGLFYGHTHRDEFQIAYTDYTKRTAANALAMSYIAPAMTPTSGNPTFRVYSVDPDTFAVLDFDVYMADMSKASYQVDPVWEHYYSAKQAYGALLTPPVTDPAAELTPAFWHNVTELFERDDAVFAQYMARKSRGYSVEACDAGCKNQTICQQRAAEAQYNCAVTQPGIHFRRKRSVDVEAAAHDDCGASLSRRVFSQIAVDPALRASLVAHVAEVKAAAGESS